MKLEVNDLSLRLGDGNREFKLKDISFSLVPAEFLVIIGPSGIGKTSLLKAIAGLIPIESGAIYLAEKCLSDLPANQRKMAMVFQKPALYPHMSVAQNIGFSHTLNGVKDDKAIQAVQQIAQKLGISELLEAYPDALSGGQQQRVALARAALAEPSVFLFDEPFSNLDPSLRQQLRIELIELHHALNTTSVFVTHDQQEALILADRIALLSENGIEQLGSPEELLLNPCNQYVAEFFGQGLITKFAARYHKQALHFSADLEKPFATSRQQPEQELYVLIRSKHIQLCLLGGIEVEVMIVEDVVDEQRVHFRGKDGLNNAKSESRGVLIASSQPKFVPGQMIRVDFAPQQMLVFNQDGERIALQ